MTEAQQTAADWLAAQVLAPIRYEDNPPYEADHGIGIALNLIESLAELSGDPLNAEGAVKATRAAFDSLWPDKDKT